MIQLELKMNAGVSTARGRLKATAIIIVSPVQGDGNPDASDRLGLKPGMSSENMRDYIRDIHYPLCSIRNLDELSSS